MTFCTLPRVFGFITVLCLVSLYSPSTALAGDTVPSKVAVAVELASGIDPVAFAQSQGAEYGGQIGALSNYYLLRFPATATNALTTARGTKTTVATRSKMDSRVRWALALTLRRHQKFSSPLTEPLFPQQWYLINQTGSGTLTTLGASVNAPGAWARGITGQGVVVGVVDDGFDPTHVDLAQNYRADLSYDFNFNDPDPTHDVVDDGHSVAVGGIIGAVVNDVGVAGIAYGAQLASLRILSDDSTEATDAAALTHRLDAISIYNNSWGPGSNGNGAIFAEIDELTEKALEKGTTDGRGGKGAIYLWSSGNDRIETDRADYDGYTASRYTIAVTAVGRDFTAEDYAEGGSCVMVTAPSTDIVTTDITGADGYSLGNYSYDFNGTSASCPMASGVVALMLQANPNLTWRDVQHVLIHSANPRQLKSFATVQNPVVNDGHDYYFGYGLVNADAAVALASKWTNVPAEAAPLTGKVSINKQLGMTPSTTSIAIPQDLMVERVMITTTINHPDWGDLKIVLTSPSGVQSILAEPHTDDGGDYGGYTFSSVRHWGENARGAWTLSVSDTRNSGATGTISDWSISIHGTAWPASVNHSPARPVSKSFSPTTFPATLDLGSVLSDPDNDALEIISAYSAKGGSIQINEQVLTYTPAPYSGNDTIYYLVSDNQGGTRWGDCTIITPNYGRDDTVIITPGVVRSFDPTTNDRSINTTTARVITPPKRGTVQFTAGLSNATFQFTPLEGYTGYDSFTYNTGVGATDNKVKLIMMDNPIGGMRFRHPQSRLAPLDSSSAHAKTPLGPLSIEAWIYPEGWGYLREDGYGRIFDQDFALMLNQQDNGLYNKESMVFYITTSSGDSAITSPAGSIKLNQWQQVAVTYNSGSVKMYINGAEVEAKVITTAESGLVAPIGLIQTVSGAKISIGNNADLTRGFKGIIRDVRVWKSVRTAAEVMANQGAVLDPALLPDLVNYWPMNQGNVYPLVDLKNTTTGGLTVNPVREGDVFPDFVLLNPPEVIDEVAAFFPGAVDQGDGWHEADWLGWMRGDYFPFIWHLQHGWLYAATPGTSTGGWCYTFDLEEWWYISRDFYPFIYSANRANWLWYQIDSANPRTFFDFKTNSAINVTP